MPLRQVVGDEGMREYVADVVKTIRASTVVEADSGDEAEYKAKRYAKYGDYSGATVDVRVANVAEVTP